MLNHKQHMFKCNINYRKTKHLSLTTKWKRLRIKDLINEQIPAQGETDKCLSGVVTHALLSVQKCSLNCFLHVSAFLLLVAIFVTDLPPQLEGWSGGSTPHTSSEKMLHLLIELTKLFWSHSFALSQEARTTVIWVWGRWVATGCRFHFYLKSNNLSSVFGVKP